MTFLQSIQSKLPRPDNRSRPEIDRDLEDEFAFHLEMRARAIEAEEGVEGDAARGLAHERFGNIERIKRDCQRIALKERIMLQRVNFVMMIVVLLIVVAVGAQVMITQRYNTLALQAITADLARMKFEAQLPAEPVNRPGLVRLEGDFVRGGAFSLPTSGILTLDRLVTAAGGIKGGADASISVMGPDGRLRFMIQRWRPEDPPNAGYVIQSGERITAKIVIGGPEQPSGSGTQQVRRVEAVGDFVVRLFAVADPRDPNLDQSIRDFLDREEKSLDAKYADDPLTAGMIRELIAARRKILEADANALRASDAEAKARAVTEFLSQTLASPDINASSAVNVRDVLDHASKAVEQNLNDDPETAARVRAAITAATWQANADDGAADTSIPLTDEQLTNFISRLMVASIPNADAATLPTRAELDRAEKAIAAKHAGDPTLLTKLNDMITTVRTRLDAIDAAPNASDPHAGAVNPDAAEDDDRNDDPAKLSPFRAVRWKDYVPFVNVEGTWGELLAINDTPVAEIITFCANRYGSLDRKRFTEDLIRVMDELGKPVAADAFVKLSIKELKTGTVMSIERAMMTEANRRLLWEANNAAAENDPPYPAWTGSPPAPAAPGEEPQAHGDPPANRMLSPEAMHADLNALAAAMRGQFSYLHVRAVDLDDAIAETRATLVEDLPLGDFAFALQKLIARFGDGHAGIGGLSALTPPPFAPFQMREADKGRIAAFAPDASTLLDRSHPYLVSVNGVPIDRLLHVAKSYVANGSPALIRRRSIDIAHRLGLLAKDSRLACVDFTGDIVLELGSEDGVIRKSIGPPLGSPQYASRPDLASGLIANGTIGYIRLAVMNDDAARLARGLMPGFRGTRGLIIDVRGNGGGSRDALLALLPHVLAPDRPPMVLNIAAYRVNDAFSEDHLAERFMYRRDDGRWSEAERQAIDRAMTTFKPAWLPPERDRDFSDWHYLIVSREKSPKANPSLYHYDTPVIVLCDGDCFSATDIFLGAFKGLPNVTLLGTASSGGSGRKQSLRLPNSGLTVSLSSMISYLPDGSMFDLHGVQPDVVVEPLPTDFIIDGGTDTQLDAAIRRIGRE